MKELHFTTADLPCCPSRVHRFIVHKTKSVNMDLHYAAVTRLRTQNEVRHTIAILCRMDLGYFFGDIKVSYDDEEKLYTLWGYTHSCSSSGDYFSGILHAYKILKKRNSGSASSKLK